MSRQVAAVGMELDRFPRSRGDEPEQLAALDNVTSFSPLTRG